MSCHRKHIVFCTQCSMTLHLSACCLAPPYSAAGPAMGPRQLRQKAEIVPGRTLVTMPYWPCTSLCGDCLPQVNRDKHLQPDNAKPSYSSSAWLHGVGGWVHLSYVPTNHATIVSPLRCLHWRGKRCEQRPTACPGKTRQNPCFF